MDIRELKEKICREAKENRDFEITGLIGSGKTKETVMTILEGASELFNDGATVEMIGAFASYFITEAVKERIITHDEGKDVAKRIGKIIKLLAEGQ